VPPLRANSPPEGERDDPFNFHTTPDQAKVALFLEEWGITYELVAVDTSNGEQHRPSFPTQGARHRRHRALVARGTGCRLERRLGISTQIHAVLEGKRTGVAISFNGRGFGIEQVA